MTTTVDELIEALRCSSCGDPRIKCKLEKCKYYYKETEEEIEAFCMRNEVERFALSDGFFGGCDFDRIGIEAADTLEMLQNALKDLINKPEED